MELLDLSRILGFSLIMYLIQGHQHKEEKHQIVCDRIARDPIFEPDMVIGYKWNIYYAWNMNLSTKCLELEFRAATHTTVNRIWNDMNEYLESQPYWLAATLTLTIGSPNHEMLLLADQGPAGKFTGVPNVMLDSNISPVKKSVPLLKFQFKVLRQGKYLLMSDCQIGLTTLASRGSVTSKKEIEDLVSELRLGEGSHACA